MDPKHIDSRSLVWLSRALTVGRTRRRLVASLGTLSVLSSAGAGLGQEMDAAAASKHNKRQRRRNRQKRHDRPDGTPYLALDLIVENRLGRQVSLSSRGTNTNWGNGDFELNHSLWNGDHYDFYGHHEDDDTKTISRWEVFVQGPATPVWLMVENPNLWPMNVSVMQGGWFNYDPQTKWYDAHADRWLVDRQWLFAGGSLVTTVADAHVRVTYERQADTGTHMVVHAWLDPA